MKTQIALNRLSLTGLLLMFFSIPFLTSCDKEDDTETLPELTQQEKDMLIQMREEEKLARDVYDYLYNQTGLMIFDNISSSEQMHMDLVLGLLQKYNLPDPASDIPGEFSNPELQSLYDQLITNGSVSEIEALKVGATIEDLDIYDLEEFSKLTTNDDILEVFDNLTCGSRNHMRAFYGQLLLLGETYSPQYISQSELDAIINSSHERCN